jgi:nucleotide-binding universal stress UspA family protein
MKTFLVPVDFSAVTEDIVDETVAFARAFGGKVQLLHVVQLPVITSEFALPPEALQSAVANAERSAEKRLAKYVEMFRAGGIEAHAKVAVGQPVFVILDEAQAAKADFIVMGSHGHGRLYDMLVGSTTSGVMKRARCGVIVLPPEDRHGG